MKRRWALAAAALVVGAAAATGAVDVEVRNGDQLTGTISAAAEVETIRFRAPKDAVISVKAKSAKKGPALHVVLKDPDGAQAGVPKDGRAATIAGVVAAKSGLFSVEIGSQDGASTGDFSLSVSWKSRATYGGKPVAVVAAGTEEVPFAADAGATATLSVKRAKKSPAAPTLSLLSPPGSPDGELAGSSMKRTLGETGDYVLTIHGGAADGDVVASVKIKPPKASKRKLALTSQTIGGAGSGGYALASVVGPGGGSVTVPSIGAGEAGSPISGSSVTIPAGALPAGTSIIIATTTSIAPPTDTQSAGPTVLFGPEGVRFDAIDGTKRALVTIPFDPAFSGDTSALQIFTRDAKGKVTLVAQPPAYVIDPVGHTMTFETSHFSSFETLAPAGTPKGGNFVTIASVTDPEDTCNAFDTSISTTPIFYFVAEGGAGIVGALRLSGVQSAFTHETFVGGGTQTGDGVNRLQFQFVDAVKSVFALVDGTLYVATTTQIFRVDASTGGVFLVAGTGQTGDAGDNGSPLSATFTKIRNILVDLNGGIFVADEGAHRIRFIDTTTASVIKPWAGAAGGAPGIGQDGGNPATTSFVGPTDMVFSQSGGLYVADGARIRLLNPFGQPSPVNTTVAGDSAGSTGSTGDGGAPTSARFQVISGIAQYLDIHNLNDFDLAVSDESDQTIRVVDLTAGTVTLVAGVHGTKGFNGDNGSTPGLMSGPIGIVSDTAGVTICDKGNGRVRTILPGQ